MTVETILEKELRTTELLKPKSKLVVHCSCGTDYTMREKFPSFTENPGEIREFIRPSICGGFLKKGCGAINYIKYNIERYGRVDSNGGYVWDVSLVSMES